MSLKVIYQKERPHVQYFLQDVVVAIAHAPHPEGSQTFPVPVWGRGASNQKKNTNRIFNVKDAREHFPQKKY